MILGSLTPGLEIGEECVNRSLQPHRKAKKAERAQKKADLEYAGILEEENRLVRRFNATSLCSHLMDPNSFKKKGKIRETAKTKKPTPLKRVILKEREEKKQARENTDETKHEQTWVSLKLFSEISQSLFFSNFLMSLISPEVGTNFSLDNRSWTLLLSGYRTSLFSKVPSEYL